MIAFLGLFNSSPYRVEAPSVENILAVIQIIGYTIPP